VSYRSKTRVCGRCSPIHGLSLGSAWDVYDGYPVIGDAYESPGGYFLTGHPTNIVIYHWFKIRGYYSSGAGTDYEDSESGAEALSGWPVGSVPKYSSIDTVRLIQILGERGYIW
jgi:hypothetical protein